MLALSRRSQEAVVVGGLNGFERMLKIIELEVRGGEVKLGFELDPAVSGHRSEGWERIRAAGAQALAGLGG
jgi:sRNA-binding carbon storage regulator CsrA